MFLGEVITEAEIIKGKIDQLENFLFKVSHSDSEKTDKTVRKLVELIDKYRSHLILLNRIENKTELLIADSKVSIINAKLICSSLKSKIMLLDKLIDSDSAVLDIFSLIEQRDKLLTEYVLISNSLKQAEWSTKID
jgi:hypothetical protein